MTPLTDRVVELVQGFCKEVDGGCSNCSADAVKVLTRVFPEWAATAQAELDRYWDEVYK